jgi:hypothetical protein
MQQSGLPMAVHAAAFKGATGAGKASVMVTVQVGAGGFRFTEKDGLSHDVLDLTLAAVDVAGKLSVTDSQVKLDLKPRTRQFVDAVGFRCITQIELLPGRYQLRVVGRAQNAAQSGSVYYDLEVPDFAKPDLVLSGIAISSATAALVPTAGVFEPMKGVLSGPPTVSREFFPLDTLSIVAEIYDNKLKTPHTLDITTAVLQEDGIVRFSSDEQRKTEELTSIGGGSFVHKAAVPLKDLLPGTYTLRVEARSRLGKTPPAMREVVFRVVEPPKGS